MARVDSVSMMNWCRALRHGLDVGLSPAKVFRQQGKTGPSLLRSVSADIGDQIEEGESIADAMQSHATVFPSLVLELVRVGEQSGRLPNLFGELEVHYQAVATAQRQFRNSMIKPVVTYAIATLVMTLLIFVLGMLPSISGRPMDPLGLGLTGTTGALAFLTLSVVFASIVIFSSWVVIRSESLQTKLAGFFLNFPVVGSCLRNFALSRFCLTMHATIEAGMKSDLCVKTSLKAAMNERYVSLAAPASSEVRRGEEIASVLASYGHTLFPDPFVQSLQLGDETGRLAEILEKDAVQFREEAHRTLEIVVMVVSRIIYAMIAMMVIFCIYKIFSNSLGAQYQQAMDAVDDPQKWLRGR
jgi:type IV pilus assembly protein PilC